MKYAIYGLVMSGMFCWISDGYAEYFAGCLKKNTVDVACAVTTCDRAAQDKTSCYHHVLQLPAVREGEVTVKMMNAIHDKLVASQEEDKKCGQSNPLQQLQCKMALCDQKTDKEIAEKLACYQALRDLPAVKSEDVSVKQNAEIKDKIELSSFREEQKKRTSDPVATRYQDKGLVLSAGFEASTFSDSPTPPNPPSTNPDNLWASEGLFVDFSKNWELADRLYLRTGTSMTKTNVQQNAAPGVMEVIRNAQVINGDGYFIYDVDAVPCRDGKNEKGEVCNSSQADLYAKFGGGFLIPTSSKVNDDFLGKAFGGIGIMSLYNGITFNAEVGVGYEDRFNESLRLLQGELAAYYPSGTGGSAPAQAYFFKVNWSPDMKNGEDDYKVMLGVEKDLGKVFSGVSNLVNEASK
ncbi:MAG: hypothetical protein HQM00_05400 [Magnetococcales bacterium]|nr:hypothetical protein [Magnetococcales bacterium]